MYSYIILFILYTYCIFQNELTKNEDHINKLRETIEWGEETLLAWNNDLCKRNTDVNILETYHLEDNIRFKVKTKFRSTYMVVTTVYSGIYRDCNQLFGYYYCNLYII